MSDNKMASFLSEALGIKTAVSPVISELMRGFRQHFLDFLKLEEVDNVDL